MPEEPPTPFPREEIAERAREIWEREGRPVGRDVENWFRAERELRLRRDHEDKTQAFVARTTGGPTR